jgi:signal transduction histidine kinase
VRLEVADNGNGEGAEIAASPSTGVGLANIRDRLSQAYGASHRFETRQNDRGGFSVILEIPFETGETA